ncbi:hypothetical protein [Siphonobacter sp. SORGH_AS_0500]|uniref:hypothetical protein n=1 Tax=Siphonobacter sp. SORGH_AS_0500 TaxID=1864824 RepID=UPI002858062F|nr:hypothetical protein [Siphonobacter sp. SORGH_AS_0500]MDR6197470.1 hypothetical protein [Siphonobacter sp. SORGH_AS_0500]
MNPLPSQSLGSSRVSAAVEWGWAGLVKLPHEPASSQKVIRSFASLWMTDADNIIVSGYLSMK